MPDETPTTVSVALADLETLLFASAAIKTIEGAMTQRSRDPFVRPHLIFGAAYARLEAEWRNAQRAAAGTATGWDDPLTPQEFELLRGVCESESEKKPGRLDLHGLPVDASERNPGYPGYRKEIDTALAKGLIRMGQCVTGVLWSGDSAPVVVPVAFGSVDGASEFLIQLTPRGLAKLRAHQGQVLAAQAHKMKAAQAARPPGDPETDHYPV